MTTKRAATADEIEINETQGAVVLAAPEPDPDQPFLLDTWEGLAQWR